MNINLVRLEFAFTDRQIATVKEMAKASAKDDFEARDWRGLLLGIAVTAINARVDKFDAEHGERDAKKEKSQEA
jgi:hypothetical protein